ncbi:hypothetical protein [Azospirillum sp. sgz302134]
MQIPFAPLPSGERALAWMMMIAIAAVAMVAASAWLVGFQRGKRSCQPKGRSKRNPFTRRVAEFLSETARIG